MEESCLLCLDARKNDELLDGIKLNTTSWHELNIKEIIEKHFWPLNDMLLSCTWLCLKCWQEVRDFHEFYVRIEKAHQRISQDLISFSYLDTELHINDKEPIKSELPLEESNISEFVEDPLEKFELISTIKEERQDITDNITTERIVEIKAESDDSTDLSNSNSNSDSDMGEIKKDAYYTDGRAPTKRSRTYIKRDKRYKDNDLFIMEHFKQMFCDLCQVKFEDFPGMQKHFMDEHKQVGYLMCCSRKFFHRSNLVDHIHVHLNPNYFKCDQCGKVLSDRAKLKNHMLSIHQQNHAKLKHCCDICGKSFIKSSILLNHKLRHLPKEEKKFPCSDCGKHYVSSSSLKLHREVIHLNKLAKVCYICGLTLRTSTQYRAHMNKHEGITLNMHCNICGLRFTSESGLKLHKETQHPVGGKQEHKCTICHKVSPTLRALKKHFTTMHVKGYEYKCTLCGKEFRRPEALKEHNASHTGTALYTCSWCPKTFNSNGNMHAHRRKMHPKECEEARLQKYVGMECLDAGNVSN